MNAQLDWTHETTLFKLRQPLRTAKGLISDRHSVTLRVGNDHEAACGLGEASPLPGWSPEDHNDVLKELVKLPRQLPRFQPHAPESLNQWLDELEITSSSLRFAVAAALVDYEAQTRDKSFGDMLGERRATSIPIAMLCTDSTTAASAYQQGVRVFKVKAGLNADTETKLLSELVSLGTDVSVRVDVNQGWSYEQACLIWQRWKFAWKVLEFIEEPLASSEQGRLRDLLALGMPLAFDESIRNQTDLEHLMSLGLRGVIVLKPSLIGTPHEVLTLARQAVEAGFGVMVSNLIETSVTRLYCAHLASLLEPTLAAGLGTGKLLAEDWGELKFERDSVLRLSNYRTSQECVR